MNTYFAKIKYFVGAYIILGTMCIIVRTVNENLRFIFNVPLSFYYLLPTLNLTL